jgi:hypothetical protein
MPVGGLMLGCLGTLHGADLSVGTGWEADVWVPGIMSPSYSAKNMIIGLSVMMAINLSSSYLSSKIPND